MAGAGSNFFGTTQTDEPTKTDEGDVGSESPDEDTGKRGRNWDDSSDDDDVVIGRRTGVAGGSSVVGGGGVGGGVVGGSGVVGGGGGEVGGGGGGDCGSSIPNTFHSKKTQKKSASRDTLRRTSHPSISRV